MRHTAAIQDKPGQKQAMIRDIEMHPRKPTMKAIVTTEIGRASCRERVFTEV